MAMSMVGACWFMSISLVLKLLTCDTVTNGDAVDKHDVPG